MEASNEKELALPYTTPPPPRRKSPNTKANPQPETQILSQLQNIILTSEHRYGASSADTGWLMRQFCNQLGRILMNIIKNKYNMETQKIRGKRENTQFTIIQARLFIDTKCNKEVKEKTKHS